MDVIGTLTGSSLTLVVTALVLAGYRTGWICSRMRVAACGWLTYTCGLTTVLVTRGIPFLPSVTGAALLAVLAVSCVLAAYRRDRRYSAANGHESERRLVRFERWRRWLQDCSAEETLSKRVGEPGARAHYQSGIRWSSTS